MMAVEENIRITRVGPGTPGGELLHPFCNQKDLAKTG